MHRKPYVFGHEAEPADERPTEFGQTDFNLAIAATAPAPWQMSQYSTFDEPSHAIERVAAIGRERALRARLGLAVVSAAVAIASIAALA